MKHPLKMLALSGALFGAAPFVSAAQTLPAVSPVASCATDTFNQISFTDAPTTMESAELTQINGHSMCVVKGYVAPQIKFEVRLPAEKWTQRYLQTGCGGLCGRVGIQSPQRDCAPETDGTIVMASTDMGHDGSGGTWGANNMQSRVDFGYRGVHVTAEVAKGLIQAFYGQAPKFSYFSGCSDGGREALMSAQRYPHDFDGIAAGAAAANFLVQNTLFHGWNAKVVEPDSPHPKLSAADLRVLHKAAIAQCDAKDGTEEGIISDPSCRVDVSQLICKAGETENCLSQTAADAAAKLYQGAVDPDNGQKLVVGSVLAGSELGWEGVFVPRGTQAQQQAGAPAMDQVNAGQGGVLSPKIVKWVAQSLAFTTPYNPNWRLDDFQFSTQTFKHLAAMHGIFDALEPDLRQFQQRGGKLLMWHGLADPQISPDNSIAYYQAVRDVLGKNHIDDTLRLFLIPGMYHCGDGYGMTSIDVMTPLMDWVESGQAPQVLVASANEADAAAGKGRDIYPFPYLSKLKAGGNADTPSDWIKGDKINLSAHLYKNWAGADFFNTGSQQQCGFNGMQFECKAAQ